MGIVYGVWEQQTWRLDTDLGMNDFDEEEEDFLLLMVLSLTVAWQPGPYERSTDRCFYLEAIQFLVVSV